MVSELAERFPTRAATRERNRAALLVAAAELALERGYERTSVDAVAQRAGLTKGAVYSIFGSKPALFAALVTPQYGVFTLKDVATPGIPLSEALTAYAQRWAEIVNLEGAKAAVLLALEIVVDAVRVEGGLEDVTADTRAVMAGLADELVEFAAAVGEELPRPPLEMAMAMMGSLQGLSLMHLTGMMSVPSHLFVDVLIRELSWGS